MAFPTTTPTKANLDQGTDSASAARSELATLVDLVTQIIQSYAQIDGICDLDDAGKVPAARIPAGASSGVDADLLDGEEGAAYHNASNLNAGTVPGARFADSSHGNRSGGSLHATATQSVAGFMSAADKALLASLTDYGAVGSYVAAGSTSFAKNVSYSAGTLVAGSSLVRDSATNSTSGMNTTSTEYLFVYAPNKVSLGLTGTWRVLTHSTTSNDNPVINLWVRVA